jgi:isoquinoline 1-oxidoreductase beta subunit
VGTNIGTNVGTGSGKSADTQATTAAGQRHGRGLACGIYKGGSLVAVVADVRVSASGQVQMTAMWCAHDCGLVLNPDGVRAQVEGCLVWCLGMVLVEALPLRRGGVAATGFDQSPLPRFDQIPPQLWVRLVDSGAEPSGAGESAMTAGAAAVANAVFDATGHRAAQLPLRPEALAWA